MCSTHAPSPHHHPCSPQGAASAAQAALAATRAGASEVAAALMARILELHEAAAVPPGVAGSGGVNGGGEADDAQSSGMGGQGSVSRQVSYSIRQLVGLVLAVGGEAQGGYGQWCRYPVPVCASPRAPSPRLFNLPLTLSLPLALSHSHHVLGLLASPRAPFPTQPPYHPLFFAY